MVEEARCLVEALVRRVPSAADAAALLDLLAVAV
jgi:hypothetical protein